MESDDTNSERAPHHQQLHDQRPTTRPKRPPSTCPTQPWAPTDSPAPKKGRPERAGGLEPVEAAGLCPRVQPDDSEEEAPAAPLEEMCHSDADCSRQLVKVPEIAEDSSSDADSTNSSMSGLSVEGQGWRPVSGVMRWVHEQMTCGVEPRDLLRRLVPDQSFVIGDDVPPVVLWKIILNLVSEPPPRVKLPHVNTLEDVVSLIQRSHNILVLTGAGVSVSCGIPDFRSRDGVYARLSKEYPDLPDPQAMFEIGYFRTNPKPFFQFAKELFPGQFEPSRSHKFIHLLEAHGRLLRNYTQNIDTLEQQAGISRVLQCHGSFATASCMVCRQKIDCMQIKEDIMNQTTPRCSRCPESEDLAFYKPDIVFFGESLPDEFHEQMERDKDVCDLLIVMGSSLKVRPVALIPNSLAAGVPQVLINREPLRHLTFDVELLGDCDVVVQELCHRLGPDWTSLCKTANAAQQVAPDACLARSVGAMRPATPGPLPPGGDDTQRPDIRSDTVTPPLLDNSMTCPPSTCSHTHTPASQQDPPSQVPPNTSLAPSDTSQADLDDSLASDSSIKSGRRLTTHHSGESFVFLPPNRYLFKGAEFYTSNDQDNFSDSDRELSSLPSPGSSTTFEQPASQTPPSHTESLPPHTETPPSHTETSNTHIFHTRTLQS